MLDYLNQLTTIPSNRRDQIVSVSFRTSGIKLDHAVSSYTTNSFVPEQQADDDGLSQLPTYKRPERQRAL
jgi:hypothetical protein